MKVYHYHPTTLTYISSENADPDPLDHGQFLLPANSTFVPIPDVILDNNRTFIWNNASNIWEIKELPAMSIVDAWNKLRHTRNILLANCDWMFIIRDYPMSYEKEMKWRQYRQALRDLPKNTEDPYHPIFPIPPN